jgi:predicted nuclease with TOPRIM domain
MATTQDHIQRIQEKLVNLVDKYHDLQKENTRLKKDVEETKVVADALREKNDQITLQLNMLKATESEDAKEAKSALEKKINEYIKEIDKCIAQLGDQV